MTKRNFDVINKNKKTIYTYDLIETHTTKQQALNKKKFYEQAHSKDKYKPKLMIKKGSHNRYGIYGSW